MTNCIVCDGKIFTPVYENTLKRCNKCGFITANIKMEESLLKSIYSENYFKGEEYLDYLNDKDVLQLNFKKRINLIRKSGSKGPAIHNCLEIGCAYGFFGEVLLKNISTEYKGIDVVSEAVNYGVTTLNINLVSGDYLKESVPSILYSDVFMWDVIEHLMDPHLYIEKIYHELEKGGRIYITTGDIGSLLPRLQGKNWRMIHPPSHLHYFSRKTLTLLLERYGFKIMDSTYISVHRSVRQIFYSLFLLKKRRRIYIKLFNLIPEGWYLPVNTYDIVLLTAVKP